MVCKWKKAEKRRQKRGRNTDIYHDELGCTCSHLILAEQWGTLGVTLCKGHWISRAAIMYWACFISPKARLWRCSVSSGPAIRVGWLWQVWPPGKEPFPSLQLKFHWRHLQVIFFFARIQNTSSQVLPLVLSRLELKTIKNVFKQPNSWLLREFRNMLSFILFISAYMYVCIYLFCSLCFVNWDTACMFMGVSLVHCWNKKEPMVFSSCRSIDPSAIKIKG